MGSPDLLSGAVIATDATDDDDCDDDPGWRKAPLLKHHTKNGRGGKFPTRP